jgi:hypothetical protein
MENKEQLLHLFWNCNLVHNFWFVVKNVVKICCITLPLNARGIIPGIYEIYIENQNTVNHIFYIYYFVYFLSIVCIVPNMYNNFLFLK